jgi:hypothetical protein
MSSNTPFKLHELNNIQGDPNLPNRNMMTQYKPTLAPGPKDPNASSIPDRDFFLHKSAITNKTNGPIFAPRTKLAKNQPAMVPRPQINNNRIIEEEFLTPDPTNPQFAYNDKSELRAPFDSGKLDFFGIEEFRPKLEAGLRAIENDIFDQFSMNQILGFAAEMADVDSWDFSGLEGEVSAELDRTNQVGFDYSGGEDLIPRENTFFF